MRAGLQALAVMARQPGTSAPEPAMRGRGTGPRRVRQQRRSWAVLGEMGEPVKTDNRTRPHRTAGRALRYQSTCRRRNREAYERHAPGRSWRVPGARSPSRFPDADAALELLRAELQPGDVVPGRASNAAGWALWLKRSRAGDMRQVLIAVGIALMVSILLTPTLIRLFSRQGLRPGDPRGRTASHKTKRGTPSMGGVAILAGIWAGYLAPIWWVALDGVGPSASGLLVLVWPPHSAASASRRHHQDPAVAQPRAQQNRQVPRADHRRTAVRGAGPEVRQPRGPDARLQHAVLRVRRFHRRAAAGAVRAVRDRRRSVPGPPR